MRNKATHNILTSTAIIIALISAILSTVSIIAPISTTAATVVASNASETPRYWWQAELRITVDGEYSYKTHMKNKNFDGKYAFTSVILGSMEEDKPDFIFLQAYQANQELRWSENMQNDSTRKAVNRSKEIKPDPTLNYVFQKDGILSFDFDFRRIPVPGKTSVFPKTVKKLRLPESAGDSSVKTKTVYNKGIVDGSNRLELPKKEIYAQKEITRTYRWKWQEQRIETEVQPRGDTRAPSIPRKSWLNRHTVEVNLKIFRVTKPKQVKTEEVSAGITRN
jgi:hypothetical protein